MNIRLNLDLSFSAGVWYNNQLQLNNYIVNLNVVTNTYNVTDTQIAVDRMRWWVENILQNSIFIKNTEVDQQTKLWNAGVNLVVLPEEASDQIVAMMLYSKLNAICEGNLIVADLQLSSALSDGIRYIFDETDNYGPFVEDGWWNEPEVIWVDKNMVKKGNKDGVLKLNTMLFWKDINLQWDAEVPQEDNIVVGKFKKDDQG